MKSFSYFRPLSATFISVRKFTQKKSQSKVILLWDFIIYCLSEYQGAFLDFQENYPTWRSRAICKAILSCCRKR